jgi:hypothetical protein
MTITENKLRQIVKQELLNKLQSLIDSNTRYPVTPNFTKRDTLKSLERGQT